MARLESRSLTPKRSVRLPLDRKARECHTPPTKVQYASQSLPSAMDCARVRVP